MKTPHTAAPQAPRFKLSALAFALGLALVACSLDNHKREVADGAAASQPTAGEAGIDRGRPLPFEPVEEILVAQDVQGQPMPAHAKVRLSQPMHAVMPGVLPPMHPVPAGEQYAHVESNAVKRAADEPVSTFSLDVDSGSYAVVRRHIRQGQLPPRDAVRIEELVNYFDYRYPEVRERAHPFAFDTELSPSPWHSERQLLRVSLAAWKQSHEQLPPANLVFLVDVSGSMHAPDKLPLLKSSLKLLARQMRAEDSVALVTYAGDSAVVLEPTSGAEKRKIINAIDGLGAGGGTYGEAGLREAYQLAEQHLKADGINRVLLATDGDFNVGLSDTDALVDFIAEKRKTGIALTTLGFGQGNYNDHLMEQLADKGDGNHAYIDSLMEARKVLLQQVGATLHTVASDAKVQVEFNPATVAEYRLVGYENRLLREQDFDNDKVDAGDIGAGHTVTALYEVALHDSGGEQLPARRYEPAQQQPRSHADELAWVKLRYKPRGQTSSELLEQVVRADDTRHAGADTRFASAVAAWGEWLRQDDNSAALSIEQILELAEDGKGPDPQGYRAEFMQLVQLSGALRTPQ